jgi:hypothetical protein
LFGASGMTVVEKTAEQLAKEDIQRQTLEAAALKLEQYATNRVYRSAFRAAAQLIRSLKP